MVEELNAYGVQLFRETDVDEIATDLPYETYIDNSPTRREIDAIAHSLSSFAAGPKCLGFIGGVIQELPHTEVFLIIHRSWVEYVTG